MVDRVKAVTLVVAEPASVDVSRCDQLAPAVEEPMDTDSELVQRANNGDRVAIDELFRRHYQRAYALTYTLCSGDSEEAKDALQEAFIKAFRNLKRFNESATFYTWFFRIVVNTCIDRRRKYNRWKRLFSFWPSSHSNDGSGGELIEVQDSAIDTDPHHELESKELGRRIQNAIMALPKNQRIAFYLKAIEAMRIKEIAKIMGLAEGTVKTHLFRAIHSLQKSLTDLDPHRLRR